MGRGRIELKRIENKISRQVTFSKRRSGLLKKAREISVLCEAQVAVVIFSTKGKLFEFSSHSSNNIIERYERYASAQRQFFPSSSSASDKTQRSSEDMEFPKLSATLEVLQRNLRNYIGEDLDPLSTKELQNLEHELDLGLKRVRARKNQVMQETASQLQKKARALEEQNKLLHKEVKEAENMVVPEVQAIDPNSSNFMFMLQRSQMPPLATLTNGEDLQEREDGTWTSTTNYGLPPWIRSHLNQCA